MHTPIPSTLLPLLLFLSHLPSVSATPPACLLAAINAQDHPSDLKSLCGTLENAVAGNITQMCKEGSYKEAVSAYKATCLEGAGVTITLTSSSSVSTSTSTSATKSGTASTSGTAVASGTGATGTGSASATTTSGSTTAGATGSTASASGVTAQGGVGAVVVPGLLGLVGLAGAVLL
ncbi:hypothetical protein EYC80_002838 [Monilinia laxa]|uniref:Extracellular membrane protein CFEM domain-containing protein n=1 Tax=Monilinia laxa TaxID=61186 RepID=A0A5N6KD11_MONLA|nr:hypothetical protein EYC80_002838 [Monilinia laxa]